MTVLIHQIKHQMKLKLHFAYANLKLSSKLKKSSKLLIWQFLFGWIDNKLFRVLIYTVFKIKSNRGLSSTWTSKDCRSNRRTTIIIMPRATSPVYGYVLFLFCVTVNRIPGAGLNSRTFLKKIEWKMFQS